MLEGIRELQKKMRKFDGIPVRTEPLFPSRYFLIQKMVQGQEEVMEKTLAEQGFHGAGETQIGIHCKPKWSGPG